MMAQADTQAGARALLTSGIGKASMDGIRALVGEIDATERALLKARQADAADAFSTSYLTTLITILGPARQCGCLRLAAHPADRRPDAPDDRRDG